MCSHPFLLLSKHAPRKPPIDKWLTSKNRGRRKGFRLDVRLLPSWLAASTNRSMVCCAVGPRIHIHASISPKNLACCLSLPSSFQHATGVLSSLLKYIMVMLKCTTEGVTTGWLTMTDRPVCLAGSAMFSAIFVGSVWLVWFVGLVWFVCRIEFELVYSCHVAMYKPFGLNSFVQSALQTFFQLWRNVFSRHAAVCCRASNFCVKTSNDTLCARSEKNLTSNEIRPVAYSCLPICSLRPAV